MAWRYICQESHPKQHKLGGIVVMVESHGNGDAPLNEAIRLAPAAASGPLPP
jgi:hypothetical protein